MKENSKQLQPIYRMLGARVDHLRNSLGWTQEDLAKKVGLTRTSIANFEAGKQRILLHDVETIASAFGITPKHLLKGIWL